MKLQWTTLLADDVGRFDWDKIKMASAVFLAMVGGLALIVCSVIGAVSSVNMKEGLLLSMAGICVVPLTGGVAATVLKNRAEKKATAAVLAGAQPGRRATDPEIPAVEDDTPTMRRGDET